MFRLEPFKLSTPDDVPIEVASTQSVSMVLACTLADAMGVPSESALRLCRRLNASAESLLE